MNIKVTILYFLFIAININSYGKNKSNNQDSLRNEIHSLHQQIKELEARQNYQNDQINSQTGMLDTAFDGVSATLSSASNAIAIFGIILAIVTVALSIYLTILEKNVSRMLLDSKKLLEKNIKIKEEVEDLRQKIQKDSVGLYKIIRNEESNHIIDRLIAVPEDIVNLFGNLASRDLENEHFNKLKEAYLQLTPDSNKKRSYVALFFQHFSGLSFLDKEIKLELLRELSHCFYNAFKNDIIKSVRDYFNAVVEIGINKCTNEINTYITELCKSKYSQSDEVYLEINHTMKNRDLKFKLYDSIKKDISTLNFRRKFGGIIIQYNYENLSPIEMALIKDIQDITNA